MGNVSWLLFPPNILVPTLPGRANAHYFLGECGLEPSGLLLGWPTWSPGGACTGKCPREGPDRPVWRLCGRAWPPQAGSGVTSADRASPHSAPSVVWKERLGELYVLRFLVMSVLLPAAPTWNHPCIPKPRTPHWHCF